MGLPPWRIAEDTWKGVLEQRGFATTMLSRANGNARGTDAPLIEVQGNSYRAPDIIATLGRTTQYWEVKFRTYVARNKITGRSEHWISLDSFRDYVDVSRLGGLKVMVALCEKLRMHSSPNWLSADIQAIAKSGRIGNVILRNGAKLDVWFWPREIMQKEVVDGPLNAEIVDIDRFSEEDEETWSANERQVEPTPLATGNIQDALDVGSLDLELNLYKQAIVGLDLKSVPRYSILVFAASTIDALKYAALADFGIRVFLVASADVIAGLGEQQGFNLDALRASRLLETSPGELDGVSRVFAIDGEPIESDGLALNALLDAIDNVDSDRGLINVGQYRIVHQRIGANLMVRAGAGTGKTETLSERLMFCLAIGEVIEGDVEQTLRQVEMRDIALITFTREAALEIRRRVSRTLVTRMRVCSKLVHPVQAWLLQLGEAQISTINGFALEVLKNTGSAIGISPNVRVAKATMDFRRSIEEHLSPIVGNFYETHPEAPPIHEIRKQLDSIWSALYANGVEFDSETSQPRFNIDWGLGQDDYQIAFIDLCKQVLEKVAIDFIEYSKNANIVTVEQTISTAFAALKQCSTIANMPRVLCVDEFQDTDRLSIEFLVAYANATEGSILAVGDVKQGVYKFRGAEGNAFEVLHSVADSTEKFEPFETLSLTTNFRTHTELLNSFRRYFEEWAMQDVFDYESTRDTLRGVRQFTSAESEFRAVHVGQGQSPDALAAAKVQTLLETPGDSIAVICRTNKEALSIRESLASLGVRCDILIGGSFFRSEAVREILLFLRCVFDPSDNASLLQLMDSRWARGVLKISDVEASSSPELLSWRSRIQSQDSNGNLDFTDLRKFALVFEGLAAELRNVPLLEWLISCIGSFSPAAYSRLTPNDDLDRRRYGRNLDHLITLLDLEFRSSPRGIAGVINWLEVNVATNTVEDEPFVIEETKESTVIALTVHKAKGLEFDHVVVPNFSKRFVHLSSKQPRTSVIRGGHEELPLLVVRKPDGINTRLDSATKTFDQLQSLKEEVRLLYVTMTRAKKSLTFIGNLSSPRSSAIPASWAELLGAKL